MSDRALLRTALQARVLVEQRDPSPNAQSPVVVFHTDDINTAYEQLIAQGINATPPFDHGFAVLTAFRDPDGNNVQVMPVAR